MERDTCVYCGGNGKITHDTVVLGEHRQYETDCLCKLYGMPITGKSIVDQIREIFLDVIGEIEGGRPEEAAKSANDGLRFLDVMDDWVVEDAIVREKLKKMERARAEVR